MSPTAVPRSPEEVTEGCRDYETLIADAGGVDLQLLGIGRTGHIGFNEPGSERSSRTRRVTLAAQTRADAAAGFGGLAFVPVEAVSLGIGTILESREIVLMGSGLGKAQVVRAAWEGPVTADVPASWVRTHPRAHFCLDADAASLLTRDHSSR